MKKIVNGVSIYYEVLGEGKPVVLCHGNGEDHTIFDVLANRLKDHYQVILVDSRNHGQSERTDSYHYEVMAEDIKQLIDELKLDRPYFLGFSDGGIIGLIIAVKYPKTCAKLMVIGAN
ncbi:MAG TPA: alpha/beta hydrolase, partial [Acholeplasmataceae bacterium]|nr:alpha/beta hydrolase [Acholeplasmataceae bacterium]